MAVSLGHNQYGKAEIRMVRVTRDGDRHELKDLNVGITLSGDMADVHLSGDNANVVPTDTQKNTVYAFAKEAPVGEIEEFGLRLARHFVDGFEPITQARVHLEEYPWARIEVGGAPHDHAFVRASGERRTATVVARDGRAWVVSGLADLVVLKTTRSEFTGYLKDRYTTLQETTDRILATAVTARWRHATLAGDHQVDWAKSFAETRRLLLEAFATTHSRSLQQSLYAMASAAIANRPEVVEVRMSMPNRHHFAVDLSPFGLANDDEVFHADDRPYGLIEAAVAEDGAPDPGPAWDPYPML
jgi:urate oxidase